MPDLQRVRVYQPIVRVSNQGGKKSPLTVPVASEAEIAWAAGIIEGEGTIGFSQPRRYARIEVMMNDLDVIELLHARLGGVVNGPYHYASQSNPSWRWGIYRQEHVRNLLIRLLPWFGERRAARAREVLQSA